MRFKQFFNEGIMGLFGGGAKPKHLQPMPPDPAIAQRRQEIEDQQYDAELAKFKDMVENLAKDQTISRDQLIAVITNNRFSSHPLYRLANFTLPDTDYNDVSPQAKAARQQEVQTILQHALQWFDVVRAQSGGDKKPFDWEHEKSLATRRVTDRNRRAGTKPAPVLRGPWDYGRK